MVWWEGIINSSSSNPNTIPQSQAAPNSLLGHFQTFQPLPILPARNSFPISQNPIYPCLCSMSKGMEGLFWDSSIIPRKSGNDALPTSRCSPWICSIPGVPFPHFLGAGDPSDSTSTSSKIFQGGDVNFGMRAWRSLDPLLVLPQTSRVTLWKNLGIKCCCVPEDDPIFPISASAGQQLLQECGISTAGTGISAQNPWEWEGKG